MADEPPGPGEPGHGLDTVADVRPHPGSNDQYIFFCGACANAGVPYDAGPYSYEEAHAWLEWIALSVLAAIRAIHPPAARRHAAG